MDRGGLEGMWARNDLAGNYTKEYVFRENKVTSFKEWFRKEKIIIYILEISFINLHFPKCI